MKQIFSLALAAGVALAAAAPASAQSVVAPQEAQAPVPATQYRSAFDGYRPVAEDDATPDQTWRALNQKVGDAGGHMGMMKMDGHTMPGHKMEGHKMDGHKMEGHKMEGQKRDAHAMPMDKMPTQHAMPQPGAKPAGQPAPQHHHEGH
ncbi:hypothetical protein D3C81_460260 [compost metagenome]